MAAARDSRGRLADGFRELDDLVLHLKGLVLVRKVQETRGRATMSCTCTGSRSIACVTALPSS